ncbi:IS66 family insertion sequence element accessory protein TnpB [Enterobacter kobei]
MLNDVLHDGNTHKSLRQWPQDVALAERRTKTPEVISISVSAPPVSADTVQQHTVANDPITLHLPGGIRMCCHPSQLTDVFRALRYADA